MTPYFPLRKRKENLRIFLYGLIGLVITVSSFVLHHYFGGFAMITVLICMADIVYTYHNVRMFLRSLKRKIEQPIMIVFFMFVYWLLMFCLISVGTGVAKVPFSERNLVYPIFLMPAFEIEILLLGVIMSGI